MKSFRKKHPILFAIFATIITIITCGLALLAYLIYNRIQRARALKSISLNRTMDSIELTIQEDNPAISNQLIDARMNSMQTSVSPIQKASSTIRRLFGSIIEQLHIDLSPYKIGFLNSIFKSSEQEKEIFNYLTTLTAQLKREKQLPETLVKLKQAFAEMNNKAKLLPNSAYQISFRLEQVCRTLLARINKIEHILTNSQDFTLASMHDGNIRDKALSQWLTVLDSHIKELQSCPRPTPASINPQEEKIQSALKHTEVSSPEESKPAVVVSESAPILLSRFLAESATDESIPASSPPSAHAIPVLTCSSGFESVTHQLIRVSHSLPDNAVSTFSVVEPIPASMCLFGSTNNLKMPPVATAYPSSRNAIVSRFDVMILPGRGSLETVTIPSREFTCMIERDTYDSYMQSIGEECSCLTLMTNQQIDSLINFLESRAFCIEELPDEESDRLSMKR